jgi:thiol-disulfide isomerase/thioredoxin
MKFNKQKVKNAIFFVFIALLIIPQTRKPIQIFLQKGLAMISPSVEYEEDRVVIQDYNWQLKTLNGNNLNFEQSKGKVVVINFWATWCPPCIAEMPALHNLYADYKDTVDFYFVSNEEATVIQGFLKKNGYEFDVQIPQTKYPKVFNVSTIP